MKLFTSILITIAMVFTSCSGTQSNEEKIEELNDAMTEAMSEAIEASEFKEAKDCDEFIDQYAKWMDDYLKVIDKYLNDPMDAAMAEEFKNVAIEGASWMTQWSTNLMYCASEEKYQKRFEEISEKADEKLKEMGIE